MGITSVKVTVHRIFSVYQSSSTHTHTAHSTLTVFSVHHTQPTVNMVVECGTRLLCATTQLETCILQLQTMLQQDQANKLGASDDALSLAHSENARLLSLLQSHPPPRPTMLPQRRLKLAAQQAWACALCGALLSAAFHADHIKPWGDTFDDSDVNVQIVCFREAQNLCRPGFRCAGTG